MFIRNSPTAERKKWRTRATQIRLTSPSDEKSRIRARGEFGSSSAGVSTLIGDRTSYCAELEGAAAGADAGAEGSEAGLVLLSCS